jgi:hypothetical protein
MVQHASSKATARDKLALCTIGEVNAQSHKMTLINLDERFVSRPHAMSNLNGHQRSARLTERARRCRVELALEGRRLGGRGGGRSDQRIR